MEPSKLNPTNNPWSGGHRWHILKGEKAYRPRTNQRLIRPAHQQSTRGIPGADRNQ